MATATNENGVDGISATSAATSAVLDAAPTITTPTITGTAQEGQTLTASASSGQGDNPVTYALVQLGRRLHHRERHRLDLSGQGGRRRLHDRGGGDRHERQRRHGHRRPARRPRRCSMRRRRSRRRPSRGTAQEGQTLTASASSGQSDNPVTYAWYSSADGYTDRDRQRRDLSGQGRRRRLQDRGDGDRHQRERRHDRATSAATSAVLDAAPTITTPTITGTAQEGQTLTASASSGQGDNPVTYAAEYSIGGRLHRPRAAPERPIRSRRATKASRSRWLPPPPTTTASR